LFQFQYNVLYICILLNAILRESNFQSQLKHADFVTKFYVVRTMNFGMKLYNDQRNAQGFNLFIYLLLRYTFWAFFQPIFRGRCTKLVGVPNLT
jgi:hypothetical protein